MIQKTTLWWQHENSTVSENWHRAPQRKLRLHLENWNFWLKSWQDISKAFAQVWYQTHPLTICGTLLSNFLIWAAPQRQLFRVKSSSLVFCVALDDWKIQYSEHTSARTLKYNQVVQVLANEKSKEEEVAGSQRHSSVWASLVFSIFNFHNAC